MQSKKLKDLFIYEIDKSVIDKVDLESLKLFGKCFDRIELNLSIVSMSLIIDSIFDFDQVISVTNMHTYIDK